MRKPLNIAVLVAVISLPIILSTLNITPQSEAFTMENNGYIIQGGNVDFSQPKSQTQKPTPTPIPGSYSGEKYDVSVEPLQEKKGQSLSFSVDDITINFGDITPGEPISRTARFSVTALPESGYQIVSQENHELRNDQGQNIPDTTCDSGNCSAGTESIWDNPLTYGFGYRCNNIEGSACLSDFAEAQSYKSIANQDKKQAPQIISSGNSESITENVLKVNIPQSQAKGVYQNVIRYILVPKI